MFALDPAFLATSEPLTSLRLCDARLQADARFPWIVLIPRIAGAVEIEDLAPEDRATLLEETLLAGSAARAVGETLGRRVAKLNVGQLGNITPQLHLHIVGRRPDDAAWPGPVWGHGTAETYDASAMARALEAAREALSSGAASP
jgi:diadenosine tetraphosphate (Ap4A) HIT family hydrolase